MASIPGANFNLTGASGSQGNLSPLDSYRVYVFPRGGYAAQDSTGTLITFDSAAVASRFAVNNWLQVGTNTANIRKVSAVGGNSLSVSGAAVTVTENDRVFLIGNTQPSTTGGSTTYIIPQSIIRQRDDDASDLYTNSMVTSNSDGLIQFFAGPNFYDALVQDGNQAAQGSIVDLPLGSVGGISTESASVFGSTVTINATLGVTGSIIGDTVTVNKALGVTGWATFGSSVTFNANIGVTGTAVFGATATFNAPIVGTTLSTTAGVSFGSSATVFGNLNVTTGIFGVSNQPRVWLVNSANQSATSGTALKLIWDTEHFDVGSLHSGSSSSINITNPGLYLFIGQVEWAALAGDTGSNTPYTTTIRKNNSGTFEVAETVTYIGATNTVPKQSLSGLDMAAAGDYYELAVSQVSGSTQTVTCTAGRLNSQFSAIKLV